MFQFLCTNRLDSWFIFSAEIVLYTLGVILRFSVIYTRSFHYNKKFMKYFQGALVDMVKAVYCKSWITGQIIVSNNVTYDYME